MAQNAEAAAEAALVGVAHGLEAPALPQPLEEVRVEGQLRQAEVRGVVRAWHHVHRQHSGQFRQQFISLLQRRPHRGRLEAACSHLLCEEAAADNEPLDLTALQQEVDSTAARLGELGRRGAQSQTGDERQERRRVTVRSASLRLAQNQGRRGRNLRQAEVLDAEAPIVGGPAPHRDHEAGGELSAPLRGHGQLHPRGAVLQPHDVFV
mmetsp:Transcript_62293/g.196699  ORF Transcript_62293/g.196699 Transcript_62293/m.196699 type:complete len:208 (-) Transcript_62293:823-1446(-)